MSAGDALVGVFFGVVALGCLWVFYLLMRAVDEMAEEDYRRMKEGKPPKYGPPPPPPW